MIIEDVTALTPISNTKIDDFSNKIQNIPDQLVFNSTTNLNRIFYQTDQPSMTTLNVDNQSAEGKLKA
jgi:hypothetical protein